MREFTYIFTIWAWLVGSAFAQTPEKPRWEASATAAYAGVRPAPQVSPSGDDWYAAGRFGPQVGRFWTPHLKTEIEAATSTDGTIFRQEFRTVPGSVSPVPFGIEEQHRIDQFAARVVWQFRDNEWIHPYVSAG